MDDYSKHTDIRLLISKAQLFIQISAEVKKLIENMGLDKLQNQVEELTLRVTTLTSLVSSLEQTVCELTKQLKYSEERFLAKNEENKQLKKQNLEFAQRIRELEDMLEKEQKERVIDKQHMETLMVSIA